MPIQLKQFRIEALHGRRTIDLQIQQNTLVLVGENGTGKSTVVNFLFYFLTMQWSRLLEYDFKSIQILIEGEIFLINRREVEQFYSETRSSDPFGNLDTRIKILLDQFISNYSPSMEGSEDIERLELFCKNRRIPLSIALSYLTKFRTAIETDRPEHLQKLRQILEKTNTETKILFLPTYRRIEQSLSVILRKYDEDEIRELRRSRRRRRQREAFADGSYMELTEFGMEDIEEMFYNKLTQLKENIRNDLSNLTGGYLREVIGRAYEQVRVEDFQELEAEVISSIFARMDDSILPAKEKQSLREIIEKIQQEKKIEEKDRVVAHFLSQLIRWHAKQVKNEKDVRDFVSVCNRYLVDKEIHYDNINFRIYIYPKDDPHHAMEDEISLQMLSSGEKQIISLFSHIYLAHGNSEYFVIIDEPELSLSVPWQKTFIPDIMKTQYCTGLIAVTHSPFIFDNEMDQHTHSITDFTESIHVAG